MFERVTVSEAARLKDFAQENGQLERRWLKRCSTARR